ncbi:MAG: glycosyltransferase family 39 protein, partial [Planctomycetales bacterium]|nr:glycosyltransferase family 39 protein [Planctomycetales bacterium]
ALGAILLPILLLVMIHLVRAIRLSRWLRSPLKRIGEKLDQSADRQRWIAWPILLVLLCFCTFVRAYNVDFQTLDDDEYASVQAALAVAETGTPIYPNDIYYSRSPLHHYLAGATVWLLGGNVWVLRMGPILLGVGTGWVMYLIGSQILGSRWVGLGALLVYSLHPFLIFSSHIARFYQQQQFFAVLVFYFFYFGFVKWGRPFHRYATIWAFSAAIQSQEISAVLGLSMLLGFVAFSHFVKTSEIIKLAIHAACLIGCLAVDFAAFQLICLTRLEGVSPNVEASVKPNFTYALNLLAMLVTYGRVHLTLSVFVLIGIAYGVKRRDKGFLFLALMAFSGILFAVTFITGVSLRYQYWIIAPWILMSVYGLAALCQTLGRLQRDASSLANLKIFSATVLTAVLLLSFSPWRIVGSYHVKILGDATGAMQYVAANLRPGDKVGATEPHPHAALLETGRSDFDIAFPLLWDFTHKDEQGYTLDRNGGARVIGSMADLQLACANHDRIFFCINREKFRSRGKNIRWEYPSARAELFFRENCMLVHRSYLWNVYLWDKNRGTYEAFRSESP